MARRIGNAVGDWVRGFGHRFDLSRLDGVTVAFDYAQALAELDRGYETTFRLTPSDGHAIGVAMTPTSATWLGETIADDIVAAGGLHFSRDDHGQVRVDIPTSPSRTKRCLKAESPTTAPNFLGESSCALASREWFMLTLAEVASNSPNGSRVHFDGPLCGHGESLPS